MKRYVLQKRMDENGESLKAGRGVMMLSVAQGGNDRGLEGGRRKARNCFRGRMADIQGEGTGRARTERKCSSLEPSGLLSALLPQG